jgi:preprotein translocase subunit SecA
MASTLCQSPLVKHYNTTSVSPFSSKFLHFHKDYHQISHMRSSKYLQIFDMGAKTINLGGSRGKKTVAMASLGGLLSGIFKGNDTGEATRQQYASTVDAINRLEAEMLALSDSELRDKTLVLKERAQRGEPLDSLLHVSF